MAKSGTVGCRRMVGVGVKGDGSVDKVLIKCLTGFPVIKNELFVGPVFSVASFLSLDCGL